MKFSQSLLLSFTLLSLIAGCNPQTNDKASSHDFQETYLPPVFENDQRAEHIESKAEEIHTLIEEHAEERKIPGIVYGVVVDGALVVSGSTGVLNLENENPATTQSEFRIASMSKSFTAMAILKLRDEGKLSLEDPASKYISEMADLEYLTADASIIDIENLLTMTAGFPEDNPWGDRQLDETNEMLLGLVADGVTFSNTTSYGYEYSNLGFALLGNIIEQISGLPYQEYIRQNILLPLGMDHTYYEFSDVPEELLAYGYRWEDEEWKSEPILHDGSFGSMGGLITSIKDFSKYVSFHLSAWPPRSDEETGPIKRSSLREMHTPQFPRLSTSSTNFEDEKCASVTGYGFGLGINKNCKGLIRVSHGGALPGYGSNYVFYPDYGIGLMAFGNLTYTSPWPLRDIEKLIFEGDIIQARKLPASDILKERMDQTLELIKDWNDELGDKILAENFYLDEDKEHRLEELNSFLEKAGPLTSISEIEPFNQLRGIATVPSKNGTFQFFITLTPENSPKVQRLDFNFIPSED